MFDAIPQRVHFVVWANNQGRNGENNTRAKSAHIATASFDSFPPFPRSRSRSWRIEIYTSDSTLISSIDLGSSRFIRSFVTLSRFVAEVKTRWPNRFKEARGGNVASFSGLIVFKRTALDQSGNLTCRLLNLFEHFQRFENRIPLVNFTICFNSTERVVCDILNTVLTKEAVIQLNLIRPNNQEDRNRHLL